MSDFESVGDLDRQVEKLVGRQRFPHDTLPESLAYEQLHGDKRLTGMLVNVVDGADVGVVQGRCGASLAPESLEGLRVVGQPLGQELEGNATAQAIVLGLVDHSHSAAA